MTKVEQVAHAILAVVPHGYGMSEAEALGYARAAITAMREPDDFQLNASVVYALKYAQEPIVDRLRGAYRAAIDAALGTEG